jgi:dTDP-D-glucose 4,6-dehydratase
MFGLEDQQSNCIEFVPDRQFSEYRYAIDAAKLHSLGWKPQIDFKEGLKRTSNNGTIILLILHQLHGTKQILTIGKMSKSP